MPVLEGFMRDPVNGALTTIPVGSAVPPLSMQVGFLRDANYALVLGTVPVTVMEGVPRDASGAAVTVPIASAVAPLQVLLGSLFDANGKLVTVTFALAASPIMQVGFLVDAATYALVIA
jgi:hypothetical protein